MILLHKLNGKGSILVFLLLLTVTSVSIPQANSQDVPHVEAEKMITPQRAEKGETVNITIRVIGAGGIVLTPVDVMLILDRSGSMTGDKILNAKEAAKVFLNFTDTKDRVGLITYSNKARLDYELQFMNSTNKEELKTKLDAYKATDATNIYESLVLAQTLLLESPRINAPLVKILLTDGLHNFPSSLPDSAFREVAQEAKDNHIIIYTIGLGADVNGERLQMIAETTGGQYFFAPNSIVLKEIFEEIGNLLAFAGTNIVVTETVPFYLTYNGDATVSGNETATEGEQELVWDVGSLKVGDEWMVSYTALAGEAVESSDQVVQCIVTYITSEAASAVINLTPGVIFHVVKVSLLTAEPDTVTQGDIIDVTATIENNGVVQDIVAVEISADTTVLSQQSISLDSGQSRNVTFSWNTSDVDPETYNITVVIDPANEIWEDDRSDNKASVEVQITSPVGDNLVIIFLIFLIILTVTVTGTAYARLKPEFVAQTCRVCRGPVEYNSRTGRWYCPHCRRYLS